jgi:signal transduction histidine kinase
VRALRRVDPSALGAGISILALGVLLLLDSRGALGLSGWSLAGALAGCVVLALLARRLGPREPRPSPIRRDAGRLSKLGLVLGVLLGAGLVFAWANGALEATAKIALAALVIAGALLLISAPFWVALVRRLGAERVARARSEERSEVGAHLHDSVLQTLALIQKRADRPDEVRKLARRQERELRDWLSDDRPDRPDERLADALRAVAAEVEEAHGSPIDAVVVGDAQLGDRSEALVGATREALTNAAKFASGGEAIRLYAEIEGDGAQVFVDDRGPGFAPDEVPGDRRGVRESIVGRMRRAGGEAEIRSEPGGGGTEVELRLPEVGR